MYSSPENVYFSFLHAETLSIPECFDVKAAAYAFVQQFYNAAETGDVANAVSACADQH